SNFITPPLRGSVRWRPIAARRRGRDPRRPPPREPTGPSPRASLRPDPAPAAPTTGRAPPRSDPPPAAARVEPTGRAAIPWRPRTAPASGARLEAPRHRAWGHG